MNNSKEKIFTSKKDNLFSFIIIATCFLLCSMPIFYLIKPEEYKIDGFIMIIFILTCITFLLWTFFGIKYKLTPKELKYNAGPIKGAIKIESIKRIERNKTMWSGTRIASSRNGLIIKYNSFDEIYISPKSNEEFLTEILKINPHIKIED